MKEIKLFVGTPVHSDVSIHYMQSMLKFQAECLSRSIHITIDMMKSSLVTQGRNTLVSHFLSDDYTHLLFIDSDILFYPNSIFKMIDKDVEVCSIPYPMKVINWNKVFGVVDSLYNDKGFTSNADNFARATMVEKALDKFSNIQRVDQT